MPKEFTEVLSFRVTKEDMADLERVALKMPATTARAVARLALRRGLVLLEKEAHGARVRRH